MRLSGGTANDGQLRPRREAGGYRPVCVGVVLQEVAVRSPKLLDGRGVAIGVRRGTYADRRAAYSVNAVKDSALSNRPVARSSWRIRKRAW